MLQPLPTPMSSSKVKARSLRKETRSQLPQSSLRRWKPKKEQFKLTLARRNMMRKWRYSRRLRSKRRTRVNLWPLRETSTTDLILSRTSNSMKVSRSPAVLRVASYPVAKSRELPSQEPSSDSPKSFFSTRLLQPWMKILRRRCRVPSNQP